MDGGALEATQAGARVGLAVAGTGAAAGVGGVAGAGAGAGAGSCDAGCQCHLDVGVDAAGAVGALQIATANNCKANGKPIRGKQISLDWGELRQHVFHSNVPMKHKVGIVHNYLWQVLFHLEGNGKLEYSWKF